jgi:hypothetical protein
VSNAGENEGAFYFACPTEELSNYTNLVGGLVTMHITVTGEMPSLSPITGEPQYNEDRVTTTMMAELRTAAGVKTIDQAVGQCEQKYSGQRLLVLKNSSHAAGAPGAPLGTMGSYLVADERTGRSFWMPRSCLDPAK